MLLIFLLVLSCKSINYSKTDDFVNQFFNNGSVYSSLSDYYKGDVVLYDEKGIFTDNELKFKHDSVELYIRKVQPTSNNFFRIYDFILNKDLGFVVLSTSDRNKGIIYYLKRNKKDNKWSIMDISKRNSK